MSLIECEPVEPTASGGAFPRHLYSEVLPLASELVRLPATTRSLLAAFLYCVPDARELSATFDGQDGEVTLILRLTLTAEPADAL